MPSGSRLPRAWSGTAVLDEEFILDVIVVVEGPLGLISPTQVQGEAILLRWQGALPRCCRLRVRSDFGGSSAYACAGVKKAKRHSYDHRHDEDSQDEFDHAFDATATIDLRWSEGCRNAWGTDRLCLQMD